MFTPDTLPDSVEKKNAEYERLRSRILEICQNPRYAAAAAEDSVETFMRLGLTRWESLTLYAKLMEVMEFNILDPQVFPSELPETEDYARSFIKDYKVSGKNLIQVLDQSLKDRAALIHQQVSPHLQGTEGPVLDFGAGDLQVTQKLQDDDHLDIRGVDVRNYRMQTGAQNPVPFEMFDGKSLPFADQSFSAVLATNVLHHAGETEDADGTTEGNEDALRELCRVAKDKIVIIETVPDPEQVKADPVSAMERTFWNDYLYNRLFHEADVPVPGRYETKEGWLDRFAKHGWQATKIVDLAYDQPTIRDYHVLYVFERRPWSEVEARNLALAQNGRQKLHSTVDPSA